jgi:hypothetical protein
MTQKFWDYSIFEETENTTLCHGTAANLYSKDDFRMLMCGKVSMDDFYVIHHEMGSHPVLHGVPRTTSCIPSNTKQLSLFVRL